MGLFTKRHSKLIGDNLHGIVWQEAADAASRLALTVHSDDNGKVVHQLDDDSHWVLVDHSGPTYVEITAVGVAAVTSVFTRTGDVGAAAGDYDASEVANDSGVAGTMVSDALDQLDSDVGTHTHTLGDVTDSGSAASEDVGVTVGDVAQLIDVGGGSAGMPAVDGSQLTGITAGGSAITVEDEGAPLTSAVTKFNFVGGGVTVTEPVADEVEVTVAGGSAPVDSIFGRTGTVVAAASDYDASQIDNDSTVEGTGVDGALEKLASDHAAHLADATNPHETTLQDAVDPTTPNNDVDVPVGSPIILRDSASAALTPLKVVKANSLTDPATPAIDVEHALSNGGISVSAPSANPGAATDITASGVFFSGPVPTSGGYSVVPATNDVGGGANLSVSAGGSSDSGSTAGTLNISGGQASGGATAGTINIGTGATSTGTLNIGSLATSTDVQGDLSVDGDLTVVGELQTHSDNHLNGGTDELTVQGLGSGAEAAGRYIETDGVGGWTVIDAPAAALNVEDEGSPVVNTPHTAMNFIGGGVTATDGGGGTVNVTIAPGAAPIDTVFSRTGTVVALAGDYDASQVDNDSGVSGAFVDDALNTLETAIDSVSSEAALNTSHRVSDGSGHTDVATNSAHVADVTTNPHATDLGNIGSGTLAELNTAVTDATLIDTGDSRLSDDRDPTAHNQAYTTIDNVPTDTFLGRDTAGTGTAEALSVTDAAGLLDHADLGTGIGTNTHAQIDSHISSHAALHALAGGDAIDHDGLLGFVANEHIDWTTGGAESIAASRYTHTHVLTDITSGTFAQLNTMLTDTNKTAQGTFVKATDPVTDGDTVVDGDFWIDTSA